MTETNSTARAKPSWKKGLLVAVLAGVFAVVAGQEFLASDSPPASDAAPLVEAQGPTRPTTAEYAPRPKRTPLAAPLEQLIAHDPFKLPQAIQEQLDALARQEEKANEESLPPKADDGQLELQRTLERLKQDGVQVIVETTNGRAAFIDGKVIREGDKIDGFVVVRIAKDGIELAVDEEKK